MNLTEAQQVMLATHNAALSNGHRASALELVSGPGLGKSSIVEQTCEKLAVEHNEPVGLVVLMLSTISSVDVRGFLLPQKSADGKLISVFSAPPWMPAKHTMRVVEPDGRWTPEGDWEGDVPRVGMLFLDERAQAEDDVQKASAELILNARVGESRLPPQWRVVAASNRMSDKSGVLRPLAFLTNRRAQLNIQPNFPAWLDWANSRKPKDRPNFLTISFAQKNPQVVFKDAVPQNAGDPFCTPRTLCLMDRDLQALRSGAEVKSGRMPMSDLAREVMAGWIGEAEASQYVVHLKYSDLLPDWDDVVAKPDSCKCPPGLDAQMVCAYMLAHNVTEKTAKPAMKYMERLNVEMQVMSVRAVMAQQERASAIVNTTEFAKWLMANKKLLIASRS